MAQGISLANKCQILFGVAVVALLGGALAGPWIRTGTIVTDSQLEVSRELANEILSRQSLDDVDGDGPIGGRVYRVGELVRDRCHCQPGKQSRCHNSWRLGVYPGGAAIFCDGHRVDRQR